MNNILINLSWESVAHRRDKVLNADKSGALHLQICATQTLISLFAVKCWSLGTFSELPRGKQCNALKNTHIFRCVSGPTLYSPL